MIAMLAAASGVDPLGGDGMTKAALRWETRLQTWAREETVPEVVRVLRDAILGTLPQSAGDRSREATPASYIDGPTEWSFEPTTELEVGRTTELPAGQPGTVVHDGSSATLEPAPIG